MMGAPPCGGHHSCLNMAGLFQLGKGQAREGNQEAGAPEQAGQMPSYMDSRQGDGKGRCTQGAKGLEAFQHPVSSLP